MTTFYLNGKLINEEDIPSGARLVDTISEKYYETTKYTEEQYNKTMNYFAKLAEDREELNKRHG